MEYKILGNTGLKISRLGFGGIPIQKIDAEGTKKLIDELISRGVNFIDTARGYNPPRLLRRTRKTHGFP